MDEETGPFDAGIDRQARGGDVAEGRTRGSRRSRRLSPAERSRDFVAEAAEFFAEVGFEGGTRELARRLGVTQPLLYRYFESKEDLIRAVYRRVYLDRWNPSWDVLLEDRSIPLHERIATFYHQYTDRIFMREWIRIYLFAGLRGVEINRWYNQIVEDKILKRFVAGLRAEAGLSEEAPATREEMELVWNLHGGFVYYGIRKYIYDLEVFEGKAAMIDNALEVFFGRAAEVIARIAPAEATREGTAKPPAASARRRAEARPATRRATKGRTGGQAATRSPRGG